MKDTKPRLIRMKDHEALLAEARAADAARIAELEALLEGPFDPLDGFCHWCGCDEPNHDHDCPWKKAMEA